MIVFSYLLRIKISMEGTNRGRDFKGLHGV